MSNDKKDKGRVTSVLSERSLSFFLSDLSLSFFLSVRSFSLYRTKIDQISKPGREIKEVSVNLHPSSSSFILSLSFFFQTGKERRKRGKILLSSLFPSFFLSFHLLTFQMSSDLKRDEKKNDSLHVDNGRGR